MNDAAEHFQNLRNAWSIDASSHAVEVHAANLAASVAAENGFSVAHLCGPQLSREELHNLSTFLKGYGIGFSMHIGTTDHGFEVRLYRRRAVSIYQHPDFGAVVRERVPA